MTIQNLLNTPTTKNSECSLCKESDLSVGEISGYGALIILKTGAEVENDWYATLQPGTLTDPTLGVHCLLMPVGHIGSFAEIHRNKEFASNYGISSGKISYAMQILLEDEWGEEKGIFVPQQIIYGKHASGRNTKKGHIHFRFNDYSGGLAQHYPSDNGWRKKEIFTEQDGTEFVKALPTKSQKIDQERFEKIGKKLIEICNE